MGYQVLGVLGQGSTGLVFLARRPSGELVAVKRLVGDWVDDAMRARFYREARILALLDHPHIVRSEGLVEESGDAFLVAEYLDGPTLEGVLRAAPLTTAHALAVLSFLADALEFAHERGVVHRDLTPANVLFSAGGGGKLSDFGIAKILGPDRTTSLLSFQTDRGALLGTPAYMSPEAARGTVELTPQADIYSLGVLAYQMLVGCLPFYFEGNVLATLEAHIAHPPPSPATFGAKLPPTLEAALLQALAKNPDDRQPDVETFWNEVARSANAAWPRWRDHVDLPDVVKGHSLRPLPVPTAELAQLRVESSEDTIVSDRRAAAGFPNRPPTHRIHGEVFVPRGKRRRWFGLVVCAAIGLGIAFGIAALSWSGSPSRPLSVRSVSITAIPRLKSSHACPVVVRLRGRIRTNGAPGYLTYTWSLPKVLRGPPQTIKVKSGVDTLSEFTSAAVDATTPAKAVLRILSPSPAISAFISLHCS